MSVTKEAEADREMVAGRVGNVIVFALVVAVQNSARREAII